MAVLRRISRFIPHVDLATWGYLAGWKIVSKLPEPLAYRIFWSGADLASGNGTGAEQLRRNLARVVGKPNVTSELVRAAMRSYARYWLEAFRLPTLIAQQRKRGGEEAFIQLLAASTQGLEHLEASYARGKGVILTIPHTGNWDMAAYWAASQFGGLTTVAERLRPEVLFDAFVGFRRQLGVKVLPLTGGEPSFPQLREALEAGGVVALVGERDIKRKGIAVQFFGEETTMPVGSVELARQTGAALHVAHSWFETTPEGKPAWGFSVSPEVPRGSQAEMLQHVADIFARNIAAHPEDWHMLQMLWPADGKFHRSRRPAHNGIKEQPTKTQQKEG